jgi:hypothetical protein
MNEPNKLNCLYLASLSSLVYGLAYWANAFNTTNEILKMRPQFLLHENRLGMHLGTEPLLKKSSVQLTSLY